MRTYYRQQTICMASCSLSEPVCKHIYTLRKINPRDPVAYNVMRIDQAYGENANLDYAALFFALYLTQRNL